jgi:hypothetical protein
VNDLTSITDALGVAILPNDKVLFAIGSRFRRGRVLRLIPIQQLLIATGKNRTRIYRDASHVVRLLIGQST